jgi:hypothetical protein
MARLFGTSLDIAALFAHFTLSAGAFAGLAGCNFVSGNPRQGTLSGANMRETKEFKLTKQCIESVSQAELAVLEDPGLEQCKSGLSPGTLCRVDIQKLAPTQTAVGMEQVALKAVTIRRKILGTSSKESLDSYLRQNPQPIVVGPEAKLYIIDHHHLARALLVSYVPRTYGRIVKDLSNLSEENFWSTMERCRWVYPYTAEGERLKSYDELPKTIGELGDDPFRALAGFVRKAEGFDKVNEPFVEFRWAQKFREKLKLNPKDPKPLNAEDIKANFAKAEKAALKFAKSAEAADLPGYNGDAPKDTQAPSGTTAPLDEGCRAPVFPEE